MSFLFACVCVGHKMAPTSADAMKKMKDARASGTLTVGSDDAKKVSCATPSLRYITVCCVAWGNVCIVHLHCT